MQMFCLHLVYIGLVRVRVCLDHIPVVLLFDCHRVINVELANKKKRRSQINKMIIL